MKALLCTGLLVLTVLLVHILSTVTATRIFCRAPPVPVGDRANLTCHYPQDLSQSRKGICVVRRDSIPGSRDEFLFGCVWGNGKLRCGVYDGYQIITQQPAYDVTFQIPSHEPGTFHCDYVPPDKAVTVESCNFSLKAPGSAPSTVTPSRSDSPTQSTERSQGRNEDGDPFDVVTIVVITVILSFITAVAMTILFLWFCWRRPSGSTLAEFPEHSVVQTPSQVVEEESQSYGSALPLVQKHGKGESQTELAMKEIQSYGSASPLVQKHGKGESQTELAMKEIQPAGNVLVGGPKSTKGNAKCK